MITPTGAASAYAQARPAVAPAPDLAQSISTAASDFARVMDQVDISARGAMTGATDTHQLVQSIARAEIALDTVVAVRDKAVEAYQEILRMPV